LVTVFSGCRSAPSSHVARGVIVDVQARDIARAESVRLQAEGGQILQLKVANSVAFPPSHLREHMLFGEPVTVTYVESGDGLLATEITD
jgi:hypothetical protein